MAWQFWCRCSVVLSNVYQVRKFVKSSACRSFYPLGYLAFDLPSSSTLITKAQFWGNVKPKTNVSNQRKTLWLSACRLDTIGRMVYHGYTRYTYTRHMIMCTRHSGTPRCTANHNPSTFDSGLLM